ncbi:MAG: hypothetical protein ABIN89_16480 [Chitinophagaceae bacterium]
MNVILIMALLFLSISCHVQELFSATEPASNKAVGSIAFRVDNSIMDELNSTRINYHLIPGVLAGISKTFMIGGNIFFSNRSEV